MRTFDLSLRSSRSSYFATFRHQLTILSNDTATTEIYTSSSSPISASERRISGSRVEPAAARTASTSIVIVILSLQHQSQSLAAMQHRPACVGQSHRWQLS